MIGRVLRLRYTNNMRLKDVKIHEEDFDIFVMLPNSEKIAFLWDIQKKGPMASLKYLAKVAQFEDEDDDYEPEIIVRTQEVVAGKFRLNITQFKNELRLNSNSIKAIRNFVNKLIMDGYVLIRQPRIRSEWDDMRYLRVYKVLGEVGPICEN